MPDVYSAAQQLRIPVVALTWTALTIPQGAKDALIMLDSTTATWRMSTSAALNPATEGSPIPANGGVTYKGTATADTLVYIAASEATTIQCIYVLDHP